MQFRRYEGDNYVLDQQVVRSAMKSYRQLFSTKPPSVALLTPSSSYLRFLVSVPAVSPSLSTQDLRDPTTAILLLELRAALIVQEYAQNATEPDASANQRISKAVTEAFIAARVREMIDGLTTLQERDRVVMAKVFLLVGHYHSRSHELSAVARCSIYVT